jgi:hypothetical protein
LVSNATSALRDATRSTMISAGNAGTGNGRNDSLAPSSPTVLPRRPRRSDTLIVNVSSDCCASSIELALAVRHQRPPMNLIAASTTPLRCGRCGGQIATSTP